MKIFFSAIVLFTLPVIANAQSFSTTFGISLHGSNDISGDYLQVYRSLKQEREYEYGLTISYHSGNSSSSGSAPLSLRPRQAPRDIGMPSFSKIIELGMRTEVKPDILWRRLRLSFTPTIALVESINWTGDILLPGATTPLLLPLSQQRVIYPGIQSDIHFKLISSKQNSLWLSLSLPLHALPGQSGLSMLGLSYHFDTEN